ncbi:putative Kynurenine--oxoglutarate transaminase 1 protein, partial [Naja naja]
MAKAIQARRLEGLDQNIWVEFSRLVVTHKAVNLGQGFPNFSPPDFVKKAYVEAISGENTMLHQYTQAF